ncbi:MAG: hypothetical protein K0U72_14040 [Gammaproteobacteria bacterium]|nr:hypothetical protein [Gammaproteobacteria bacterium]
MKFPKNILLLLTIATALATAAQSAEKDNQVVLIANYQATLRAGLEYREMKGQAKVRNTHQFPIQFDDFRIFVLLIRIAEKEYRADVVIEHLEDST